MPNDLRTFLLSQYTTDQNRQANPGLAQKFGRVYTDPNNRYLLEASESPGLRIKPEEEDLWTLRNLTALGMGVIDIGKGLFGLAGNLANAATPGIELGNLPTGFGSAAEVFGLTPTTRSFGEIPGALAEATTIPAVFRRASELASDPSSPAVSSGLETAVRFIGELTVSPLLDAIFKLGIDPERSNAPLEQRIRMLPGAALAVVPAAKLGSLVRGTFAKAGLVDIAAAMERKSLLAKTALGGESFEKFAFKPGMSVVTPEGLGIIDRITKSGRVHVDINGTKHQIPKGQIFAQTTETQKIGNDFITVAERATKASQEAGRSTFTVEWLREFLNSDVMAKTFQNRLGGILSKDEIQTLSVTDQLTTILDRSIDIDGIAADMVKKSGPDNPLTLEAAIPEVTRAKNEFINALKATSTEGGQVLNFFSQIEDFFKASDRMSKDPAIRLMALEKETRTYGLPDWWERVVNQAQLSSMVSQPVTASRNFLGQGTRSIIQAIEQATFETRLYFREKHKLNIGEEVNPLWLTPEGTIDLSKMYAETLGNLHTIKDAVQDFIPRAYFFGKHALEEAKYSAAVFKALNAGEDVAGIPKPPSFRGRFAWLDDILDALPTVAMKLFNHPTGETAVAYFDAVTAANLTRSIKRLSPFGKADDLLNGSRLTEFIHRTLPATSHFLSGFFTTLNRMAEIEQRRLFFAARLQGNALRRGKSLSEWTDSMKAVIDSAEGKSNKFAKLPDWISEDIIDATQYALETTYAADPRGTIGAAVMRMYKAAPILKQAASPFPRFFFNRWAFITERNPGLLLNVLKPEFRKIMEGRITREDVVANLRAKAESKGKKFKPPSEAFIDKQLNVLRQKAQVESHRVIAKASMGAGLMSMGWFLRNANLPGVRPGPRPYDVDVGLKDEDGNTQWASLRNYGPEIQVPVFLGEAFKAISEGRDLLKDVFTAEEFLDFATGLRRIDETALAVFDFPQLASTKGTPEAVATVVSKILGSNIGRFFTFLQATKDLAGITDLRAFGYEGSDELKMTDQSEDPFLGPAIRSLPRGFQRAILKGEPPDMASPFRSDALETEEPLTRAMIGMNLTTKNNLELLVDSVNMRWSDAIGRQPTPLMGRLVASELGKFFDAPAQQGATVGDIVTDRILTLEARARANGIKDPAVRRTALREAFQMARASIVPRVRAQIIQAAIQSGNPILIQQILGPTFGRQTDELTRKALSGELVRES